MQMFPKTGKTTAHSLISHITFHYISLISKLGKQERHSKTMKNIETRHFKTHHDLGKVRCSDGRLQACSGQSGWTGSEFGFHRTVTTLSLEFLLFSSCFLVRKQWKQCFICFVVPYVVIFQCWKYKGTAHKNT